MIESSFVGNSLSICALIPVSPCEGQETHRRRNLAWYFSCLIDLYLSEMNTCPACNSPIKSGLLNTNLLITGKAVQLINAVKKRSYEAYCTKCGDQLVFECLEELRHQIGEYKRYLSELIESVPLVTIHNPMGWSYETIGIVTGQSVTGTGVLSEFSQSITDLFGGQSENLNSKIKNGEKLCFAQIRKAAIEMGGNAVIGVDIDYSELGGGRGMIMVCCSGTAVYLENLDILGDGVGENISEIKKASDHLARLSEVYNNYNTN